MPDKHMKYVTVRRVLRLLKEVLGLVLLALEILKKISEF